MVTRSTFALILSTFMGMTANSQSFANGFPFALPWNDSATVRFLPQFPRVALTDQDYVSIDADGHFNVRGNPIRFFGVNLTADGAFPPSNIADGIAGRMRKMGINIVRMHHMDNPWSSWSLFAGQSSTRTINESARDRMEYLLARLNENGIYANINLHVSRTYTVSDGIPEADSLVDFGKYLNYFDPHVLMLDKEFARQLLTHTNPYTQRTLANDPIMAMVEVTNENSLYRAWRDGGLRTFAQGGILPFRHAMMLDSLYRSFLMSKHGTTQALADAWNAGTSGASATILPVNGLYETAYPWTGWSVEKSGTAQATASRTTSSPYQGTGAAAVTVSSADDTDWHLQWKHVGLSVSKDSVYVVTFAARADSTRRIGLSVMNNVSPWTWYGGTSFNLTTNWQVFTFSFKQPESLVGTFRLSFALGLQSGIYYFDSVDVRIQGTTGLDPTESFEAQNIRRIAYTEAAKYSNGRVADQSEFYIDLQKTYFQTMRSFLRDTLGVRVPIVGTNWNVGPADLAAQASMDYLDNHAYWDHPSFPTVPWSSTDWYINNTSMVNASDGGTIGGLMTAVPMKGKPYTISEYNHSYPNRYQTEAILFSSAYGSFHDVDGIMFFEYASSGSDWTVDRVANYFSLHRNSAMMALMPSCAFAYRNGLIAAAQQTIELAYAPSDYLLLPKNESGGWLGPTFVPRTVSLRHAVRATSYAAMSPLNTGLLPSAPNAPYSSDTKEIMWDPAGLFSVAAPRFAGASGRLDLHETARIGPARITYGSGFGTFTWLSLTADSLPIARRSLLTVATRVQNTGMVWDGTTTVRDRWGSAPTLMEPFGLVLEATIMADSIRLVSLNAFGQESGPGTVLRSSAPHTFSLPLDLPANNTTWFGLELLGRDSSGGIGDDTNVPTRTQIESAFPNPFNGQTIIRFTVSKRSAVTLRLHDMLGREVRTLVRSEHAPGTYDIPLSADRISSGVYYCVLTTATMVDAHKVVLVK